MGGTDILLTEERDFFMMFWLEKPQRAQRNTEKKNSPLCALGG